MKITNFYNTDASTSWFSNSGSRLSVHESLTGNNFRLIEKDALQLECADVVIPISMVSPSWGGSIPRPSKGTANTFIARELADLRKRKYKSRLLSDVLTQWMRENLTGTQYLISLNPDHYLVATSNSISFEDIFTVSVEWRIDSWVGVFDETGSIAFIFDTEFWATIISCSPSIMTPDMQAFSEHYNNEFNEIFVRDNHLLSHADQERVEEYFEIIYKASM